MLLFPPRKAPLPPPPLAVDAVRLLLSPAPPVPLGGAPAEDDLGIPLPAPLPLADDAVVDAWLCDPFAIVQTLKLQHRKKLSKPEHQTPDPDPHKS